MKGRVGEERREGEGGGAFNLSPLFTIIRVRPHVVPFLLLFGLGRGLEVRPHCQLAQVTCGGKSRNYLL